MCLCVIYIFRRINTVSRVTVDCVVCMTVGITSRIPKEIRLQRQTLGNPSLGTQLVRAEIPHTYHALCYSKQGHLYSRPSTFFLYGLRVPRCTGYEISCLLVCDKLWPHTQLPDLRENLQSLSSGNP